MFAQTLTPLILPSIHCNAALLYFAVSSWDAWEINKIPQIYAISTKSQQPYMDEIHRFTPYTVQHDLSWYCCMCLLFKDIVI